MATRHPRDTFDSFTGETIAYGRAVKDAAKKLLARTWSLGRAAATGHVDWDKLRKIWADSWASAEQRILEPTEPGAEEMAPGYLCWQCEHYEASHRQPELGLCHEDCVFLQYPHMAACGAFRLRAEEPQVEPQEESQEPQEEQEECENTLFGFPIRFAAEQVAPATFAEAPSLSEALALAERVGALERDLAKLSSLVQNIYLSALPAVYRRLGILEARERRLDKEGVTLRERLVQLECWRERSEQDQDSA